MGGYEVRTHPGALVVSLAGSIDAYLRDFTPDVEKKLRAKPSDLVLDLSAVDFIGSRGMGILFHLHKLLKDLGKRLLIAAPSTAVTEALAVGGIGKLLETYATEAEALGALRAGSKKRKARGGGSGRKKSRRRSRRKSKGG